MFLGIDNHIKSKDAVIDNNTRLTYGELSKIVYDFSAYIDKRCICFNLCTNSIGSLIGYLGIVECDSVPLLLSSRIDDQLLTKLINEYEPYYIWAPIELSDKWDYHIVFQKYGYCLMRTHYEKYSINNMLQILMTTSGSTGSPKLVRYKKGNLEVNAKNVSLAFGWSSLERPICDLGMQYTMGLNVINSHLYVGATLILTDYNIIDGRFWDLVKNEEVSNFTGVPFSYDILARLGFERMNLPYLRTLSQGGGKLTEARFIQLVEYALKNNKRFIASFGTTETSARIACLPPELAEKKVCSIGFAIPEGSMFLKDPNGNIIDDVEAEGELCYTGPNVTMGYANCKADLSEGDVFNGTYITGDLAKRDIDGCYYITGRKSRFLKLLSYRISLDQSESLINEQFGITCACMGTDDKMDIFITDSDLSERVLKFISAKTGVFRNLFKVTVVNSIPRNDRNKIDYQKLKNYSSK